MLRKWVATMGLVGMGALSSVAGCDGTTEATNQEPVTMAKEAMTVNAVVSAAKSVCGSEFGGQEVDRVLAGDFGAEAVDAFNARLPDSCVASEAFQDEYNARLDSLRESALSSEGLGVAQDAVYQSNCPQPIDIICGTGLYKRTSSKSQCSSHVLVKCDIYKRPTNQICTNYPNPCLTCYVAGLC